MKRYKENFITKTGRGRDDLNTIRVERSPRRQVAGSNPVAPISRLRVGVCYKRRCNDPGSARVSRAGFRVSRKRTLKMTDDEPGMKPNKE